VPGLRSWWSQRRQRREEAALKRRAIPDDLWKRTLVRYPFLQRRDAADAAELRRLSSLFLDRKEFTAVAGLRLTDAMAVAVAAQACLPVLRLGLTAYDGFVGIVLHPNQARARREVLDDDGVLHAYDEVLSGEAMQGGPVMLSWPDVRLAGQASHRSYNVVIHEFAHVLDMANSEATGVPALPPNLPVTEWTDCLHAEFDAFAQRVSGQEDTALDPYAATAVEEFFAVASESFFVAPSALRSEHAALYALFTRYYQQDPEKETAPNRRRP
jgi:MtfA peptidase